MKGLEWRRRAALWAWNFGVWLAMVLVICGVLWLVSFGGGE